MNSAYRKLEVYRPKTSRSWEHCHLKWQLTDTQWLPFNNFDLDRVKAK